MKNFLTSLLMVFMFSMTFAQSGNDKNIFTYADKMPEFPGGKKAMMNYLQQNLRYPDQAREKGIEAEIISSFVVNSDGSISDIKIKGGTDTLGFNEEVIRVIKQMPKWDPGKQNGLSVAVYFNLPVSFHLEGDKKATIDASNSAASVEQTDYVITASGTKVYKMLEIMPEFPGGDRALVAFLNGNLRYPADARENSIQGTELAQFVVNTNGSITDVTIKNSLSKSCDEEVTRIIKLMPNWKAGVKDGSAVPVFYILPVVFKLN